MHDRAAGLVDRGRGEVGGDDRRRVADAEEDQRRRHQRAAAHAGQADDDADEEPRGQDREGGGGEQVHALVLPCGRVSGQGGQHGRAAAPRGEPRTLKRPLPPDDRGRARRARDRRGRARRRRGPAAPPGRARRARCDGGGELAQREDLAEQRRGGRRG